MPARTTKPEAIGTRNSQVSLARHRGGMADLRIARADRFRFGRPGRPNLKRSARAIRKSAMPPRCRARLTCELRVPIASGLVVLAGIVYIAIGVLLYVETRYWIPLVLPVLGALLMT